MHFDGTDADADAQRSKLHDIIEHVRVTRNWWAHGRGVTVFEMRRVMSSLVDTLNMLTSLLLSSRQEHLYHLNIVCCRIRSINECISAHSSESDSWDYELPLTSIVVVVFIRNWQRLCQAVGQRDLNEAGLQSNFPGSQEVELHRTFAWKGRNYIYHGKCSNKSQALLVSLCSISWLLRKRKLQLPSLTDIALQATIDDCDRDIQYLLAHMGLDNVQNVLRAVADSHQAM